MDKTGVIAIIVGIFLLAAGLYGAYFFLDELVYVVKGIAGIIVVLIGLFALLIGVMTVRE